MNRLVPDRRGLRPPDHGADPFPPRRDGAVAVLFDVDGTLVDDAGRLSRIMDEAFAAAGLESPGRARIMSVIGLSLPEMVEDLGRGVSRDRLDKIISGYRLRFEDALTGGEDPPTFPGAGTMLRRLRMAGLPLALTTGKSRIGLDHALETLGWRGLFDAVQCAEGNPSKPDPTMVHKALWDLRRTPAQAVLVGDTVWDMEMARRAGIPAIGVGWGYHAPDHLLSAGAVAIARDFGHLGAMLIERTT